LTIVATKILLAVYMSLEVSCQSHLLLTRSLAILAQSSQLSDWDPDNLPG